MRDETRERAKTSAMVFAPHQDDETLGCGGTLVLKRQAGAPVALVFMTDGTTSHRRFMEEEELRSIRKAEANGAAAILGLSPEDIHFLDFPDGGLRRFHADAVSRVVSLLDRYRPAEVYVPFQSDGTLDHESTHGVVVEALAIADRPAEICEYPIWFWNQWPWVPQDVKFDREGVRECLRALRVCFGLRCFGEFRTGVFVGDVLDRKMQALAQHRSQMTVLVPGTDWPTLADISAGEFLRCFFQDYEVFRCWNFHAPGGRHSR
jgi:LmbE family N-acetylglucosaminyl deacetylase